MCVVITSLIVALDGIKSNLNLNFKGEGSERAAGDGGEGDAKEDQSERLADADKEEERREGRCRNIYVKQFGIFLLRILYC